MTRTDRATYLQLLACDAELWEWQALYPTSERYLSMAHAVVSFEMRKLRYRERGDSQ